MADDALVHLQLRLTWTSKSHTTTSLTFQVCPQPRQSWQHIAILRQFHLRLGSSGLGTHGENVQNQTRPVQNLHLQHLLDVPNLLRRQFIVENHHSHRVFLILFPLDEIRYLLQLSATDIGHAARAVHPLREPLHHLRPCRIRQKLQLIQILRRLPLILLRCDETHHHSRLHLRLRNDKLFHSFSVLVAKVGKRIEELKN